MPGRGLSVHGENRDLLNKLGIDWNQTTADGALTVEPVYCLGLCACAPAAMLDGRLVARLDQAGIDTLLSEART